MPDIVNAGTIVIIGLFTLVAVIGAADQLAPDAEPASSMAGPRDGAAAAQDEPTDPGLLDVEERIHAKDGGEGDDDRRGKHHDGDDERDDKDDDKHDDKDDGDRDDEEGDD